MRWLGGLRSSRLLGGTALFGAVVLTVATGLTVGAGPANPSRPAAASAPAPSGSLADHRGTAIATPTSTAAGTLTASPAGAATPSGVTSATPSGTTTAILSGAGTGATPAPPASSTPVSSFAGPPPATPRASSAATSGASPTPTQAATPTPTPTATPTPGPSRPPGGGSAGFVTLCGDHLCLNGRPWTFTGVNAYEAATDWGVNAGCGPELTNTQLDDLFASLAPNEVVRFWAFQALATNYTTGQLDWAGIDRVIDTAAEYGIKVIPSLANETGGCDDNNWKGASWYSGGYMSVFDSSAWPASTPLSYWDYMQAFLQRYGDNPTIAMVELVSEPSPTASGYVCVDEAAAAQALRSFYDTVGTEAHSLAPDLLVESGLQGIGQCGTEGSDYANAMASSGVDVASYHDYGADGTPLPGDLSATLAAAHSDGKPLIVGEVGTLAQDNLSGCSSDATRASEIGTKMSAQLSAGVSGFMPWNYVPSDPGGGACSYDVGPGDPLIPLLASG